MFIRTNGPRLSPMCSCMPRVARVHAEARACLVASSNAVVGRPCGRGA